MRRRNSLTNATSQSSRRHVAVDPIEACILQRERVSRISSQCFVTAFPRQNNFDPFPGKFGDEVQGDTGRPHNRFVFVPDEFGKRSEEVFATDEHLMVNGVQVLGNSTGIGELTVAALCVTDRECLYRFATNLCHECSDCTGINSSAEKNSERHIAHQMTLYGAFQQVAIALHVISFIAHTFVSAAGKIPKLLHVDLSAVINLESVARHELANSGIKRFLAGQVPECEVFGKS